MEKSIFLKADLRCIELKPIVDNQGENVGTWELRKVSWLRGHVLDRRDARRTGALIHYVSEQIKGDSDNKDDYLVLGKRLLRKYGRDRRFSKKVSYLQGLILKEPCSREMTLTWNNQKVFDKWIGLGFSEEAFYQNPDAIRFLSDTHLLDSVEKMGLPVKETDKGPKILVEGHYRSMDQILERFEVVYKHRLPMIREKGTEQFFTYFGERGLIPYDSWDFDKVETSIHLKKSAVEELQNRAADFDSGRCQMDKNGNNRDHVLQVCVQRVKAKKVHWYNREYNEKNAEFKHSWFRAISPSGAVKSWGFRWVDGPDGLKVCETIKGKCFAADHCESMDSSEVQVTNIPVSQLELTKLYQRTDGDKSFNLVNANCSRFVHECLKDELDLDVDSSDKFWEFMHRLHPLTGVKKGIEKVLQAGSWILSRLPRPVASICLKATRFSRRVSISFVNLFLVTPLGGWRKREFDKGDEPEGYRPLIDVYSWKVWELLDEDATTIFTPAKLGETLKKEYPLATTTAVNPKTMAASVMGRDPEPGERFQASLARVAI